LLNCLKNHQEKFLAKNYDSSQETEVIWDLAIACGKSFWQCGNIRD
jgi:hypothetical protein